MAGGADAADARYRFSIPPRSYADALIDLGLQANVSILGTSSCGSAGRTSLSGRHTLEEALDRLLDGAPCRFQLVDARTVRIIPYLAPAAQAPVREPPRPPSLVSEVVVTATKRPVAVDRLPAGVSAISRDQIVTTRAIDVGQTVGQLAGVLTTNLGPGRDKLLIRGLSDGAFTGRTRSTVSTYLDDAPINYNAPDPDLRLVDIDRVEVVRGPQGALYGSGSLAGIYRIVTTKPNLGRAAYGASGTVALTYDGDPSHEIDGYLSLPIVKDRVAIRLVAYEEIQGGYLDDVNLRIANVDQTRRDGGRLALRIQLADNWRFDALAATQHLRSNDTQYITTTMAPNTPSASASPPGMAWPEDEGAAAPGERANRVREAHNNDFSYVGGTLQGDFAWGSLTSSINYVHHVFSSQFDATAALDDVFASQEDLGVYVESTRSDMLVQDLVARSPGTGRFDWLVGIYAARTVEQTPSTLGILSATPALRAGPAVSTVYTEDRKDRLAEYAIYGEGSYAFADGWTATLGGRIFESRVHTTADLNVIQPYDTRSFDQKRRFNGFSPKISLQREFQNGDLVYALITEGYRPGGFNSGGFYAIKEARTTFAPDRLRNYEVGAKFRRLDGRLAVRAAAYYDDWAHIQTDQYRPSGLAYTGNVGDARIIGLEAEMSYDWPFGLSLQVNGLISDSRIKNPNTDFAAEITGDLPGVPQTSGGLLAVYERALSDSLTLRLVGEASYVGKSGLSFNAALPSRTDDYFRAKLSAELSADIWRITAFVNNPFNYEGDTFAYGNPFSFGQVRQATPQRPRTVGVRLAADF